MDGCDVWRDDYPLCDIDAHVLSLLSVWLVWLALTQLFDTKLTTGRIVYIHTTPCVCCVWYIDSLLFFYMSEARD